MTFMGNHQHNSEDASSFDVVVVGAGPIGLETAYALSEKGHSVVVLDAGAVGSQIMRFPPTVRFFSSPERIAIANVPLESVAQEKTSREEYLAYLRSVVTLRGLSVRTYEEVTGVTGESGDFRVATKTSSGQTRSISCGSVVLAIGGTATSRKLGSPGEDLPHVRREMDDPHRYFQRTVLVVGGKNSAAESALRIWRCGGRVILSTRRSELYEKIKYWIRPELDVLVRNGSIDARFMTEISAIHSDGVDLRSTVTGEVHRVEVDDVLLQIGYNSDPHIFKALGCTLSGEEQSVQHDPATMETSVAGIYVAGTAVAGTQGSFQVYIENSHVHSTRIAAHLSGQSAPETPVLPELPEA